MKHRHVDAAAVGAVPLEPFQVPRYFKVLTVAFIQVCVHHMCRSVLKC